MSPLHVNMSNVFHTGRPRGSISSPTSVTSNNRPLPRARGMASMVTRMKRILGKYAGFVGPGILISIAYMDPGNYSTDVSAGAQFEYRLLCVILISNIFACFLQALACKLGSVTGKDFARNCHDHFPRWMRWALYILSELAIISTDLAEIIGGAIALNLLFGLNISAGVVITAFDVFLVLLLYRPNGTMRGIRLFELSVSMLVMGVVICFSVELAKTPNIDVGQVFRGFIPSGVVFTSNGIFASLGILGATIMPHALFLGSHVALPRVREFDRQYHPERIQENEETREEKAWQPSLPAIRATLSWSITEIIVSLSTFAMFVNAAILIVAGAALYGNTAVGDAGDLFAVHALLSSSLSPAAGTLFALAMLFSGQSSSIIATIVGQIICEGFINWKLRPIVRRSITRLIALIPCIVVASAIGKEGLSMALNISQVSLSILLPFISAPLIYLTSSKKVMRVAVYTTPAPALPTVSSTTKLPTLAVTTEPSSSTVSPSRTPVDGKLAPAPSAGTGDIELQGVEWVDLSSGKVMTVLGWLIWLFIAGLNVYLIVMLILGQN